MLSQWCDGKLSNWSKIEPSVNITTLMFVGEENCQDGADEGPSCSVECGSTSIPPKEDKNAWRFRSLVAARAKGVDSRIVGGVEAEPHSLPWQIALLSNKGSQMCAGSIVSDLYSPISNNAISNNFTKEFRNQSGIAPRSVADAFRLTTDG